MTLADLALRCGVVFALGLAGALLLGKLWRRLGEGFDG